MGINTERATRKYEGVLTTARYEIKDVLGQGTWGTVYRAKDNISGKDVALKVLTPNALAREQMNQRGQTPQSVLLNECGDLHACARIVPRTLEVDENGTYFLRMPVMRKFLDELLVDDGSAQVRPANLPYERVISYAKDLFAGLKEMHEIRRDVHADLKPANLAIDEDDRLYLNDLGTSTCTSLEPIVSGTTQRGERGFELTRAPECFLGVDPSRKSDVWAAGALIYRMISNDGKYPLEDEISNVTDKGAYLKQVGNDRLEELIKHKVRHNITREYRVLGRILEDCLHPEPDKRISSAELTDRINYATGKNKFLKDVWKFTKKFGVAVGAATALGYMIFVTSTVPKLPEVKVPKVSGILHLSEYSSEGKRRIYDIEDLDNLPKTINGWAVGAPASYSKNASTDMSVAFLVDAHRSAFDLVRAGSPVTDYQRKIFWQRASEEDRKSPHLIGDKETGWDVFLMPARSLEHTLELLENSGGRLDPSINLDPRLPGLKSIKTFEGHIDLEDLMTISKYGPIRVQQAQNEKGPFFKDYLGSRIFSDDERNFMKAWLAYVHEGLSRR